LEEDSFRNTIASYIEARLWDDIRTEDLAKQVNMTSSALIEKFHAAFGKTPALYIIEQRLKRV
jgi:transcriptional regulator GlxA family with amidase domain